MSGCDPPEDRTSEVQALKWAMTFSLERCRNDLSAGCLLTWRAGWEDLAALGLWSTLA